MRLFRFCETASPRKSGTSATPNSVGGGAWFNAMIAKTGSMITSLTPAQSQVFGGKRFLKSGVVMELLGYQDRASFWDFVRRSGMPHVRLNARRILFEEQALLDWIRRRSVS